MNIDERLEALTMNLELLSLDWQAALAAAQEHTKHIEAHTKQIEAHTKQLLLDGEHILALVRVAELHDRRLTDLES